MNNADKTSYPLRTYLPMPTMANQYEGLTCTRNLPKHFINITLFNDLNGPVGELVVLSPFSPIGKVKHEETRHCVCSLMEIQCDGAELGRFGSEPCFYAIIL